MFGVCVQSEKSRRNTADTAGHNNNCSDNNISNSVAVVGWAMSMERRAVEEEEANKGGGEGGRAVKSNPGPSISRDLRLIRQKRLVQNAALVYHCTNFGFKVLYPENPAYQPLISCYSSPCV